jgi:hypothetical protein
MFELLTNRLVMAGNDIAPESSAEANRLLDRRLDHARIRHGCDRIHWLCRRSRVTRGGA